MQALEILNLCFGPGSAIHRGMTIKVGTIQEITGVGFEILVDTETRSYVLAKFFDGNFIGLAETSDSADVTEKTLVV